MEKNIIVSSIEPDIRMTRFIKKHHVMTLGTSSGGNLPWCASCFYVYLEEMNWFVFTTDEDTRHGIEMTSNSLVSICIALETEMTGKIRGVQITGRARRALEEEGKRASKAFISRFPVAMLKKTTLWIVEPEYIKMTDNRLGFGKKLIWFRDNPSG